MTTTREKAQHRLDAATGDRQRLEYQKSLLNRSSKLYSSRLHGIAMQIVEADKEVAAALDDLLAATSTEERER